MIRIPHSKRFVSIPWLAAALVAGCTAIVPPAQQAPSAPPAPPPIEVTGNSDSYLATIEANRALLFHRYGDAIRWFEAAALADPKSPYLQTTLAKVYLDLGQPERALEHVQTALALDAHYAEAQFLQARIFATTDPARAAQSYEAILAANPQDPGALFQLALLRVRQNRLQDAATLLERLVAVDPQSFQARSTLAQMLATLGKYEEAEAQFLAALELQPESERALVELAVLYERWGKSEQAAATYSKVLAINPDNHQVRRRLSRLLIQQSRLGDAINELEELKKRDPEPGEARLGLGLIFLEQERVDEAITELSLLLEERPEMLKVAYYLGLALAKKGEVDRALDAFAKVGPDLPEYVDSRLRMAVLLVEEHNDPAAAIRILEEALEHANAANDAADTPAAAEPGGPPAESPSDAAHDTPDPKVRLYRVLAYAQEKAAQPLHAIQSLEAARALAPDDTNVRFDLGVLYDKQGRSAEAEREMQAVIERNPRDARALNYLGYTWADKGLRLDEAEALIRRALEIEPDDGYYIDSLGWTQFRRGDFEGAVTTLERAVELVPEDAVITEHLGDAYRAAGKKARAIEVYRRVLEIDSSKSEVQKKLEELLEKTVGDPPARVAPNP